MYTHRQFPRFAAVLSWAIYAGVVITLIGLLFTFIKSARAADEMVLFHAPSTKADDPADAIVLFPSRPCDFKALEGILDPKATMKNDWHSLFWLQVVGKGAGTTYTGCYIQITVCMTPMGPTMCDGVPPSLRDPTEVIVMITNDGDQNMALPTAFKPMPLKDAVKQIPTIGDKI